MEISHYPDIPCGLIYQGGTQYDKKGNPWIETPLFSDYLNKVAYELWDEEHAQCSLQT